MEGLFLELVHRYCDRRRCRRTPHRLCRRMWINEIPVGKCPVIHFTRIVLSLFAVHGPAHMTGTSFFLPELAERIREILHANHKPCPQIPCSMCWEASLYNHTLKTPTNHCLENVGIPSSLYIPIRQNMQKNMLFTVQG